MIEIKVNNCTCCTKVDGDGAKILIESAVALNGMINGMVSGTGIPRKVIMKMICITADRMNGSDHVEIHRNGEAREAET